MDICPNCGMYLDGDDVCCSDRALDLLNEPPADENELWIHIINTVPWTS